MKPNPGWSDPFEALEKSRELASEKTGSDRYNRSGRLPLRGRLHPITQIAVEITRIFNWLGLDDGRGPEIELDYYNFEALNIPKDHPAREMQDTFYISEDVVLRTHTSPIQSGQWRSAARPSASSPRQDLPLRFRRDPHPHVPPGRRPDGGPGLSRLRFERHSYHLRPPDVRSRGRIAVPAELFPFQPNRAPRWTSSASCAAGRAAACARRRGGSRYSGPEWSTPRSSNMSAMTRRR